MAADRETIDLSVSPWSVSAQHGRSTPRISP
jgi:hypothetical protein